MGIQTIEIEENEPNSATHDLSNKNHLKEDKFTKNELVFIIQIYAVCLYFYDL